MKWKDFSNKLNIFTDVVGIIFALVLLTLLFFGCSTVKEVTTEETTTVQSITFPVPKVEGKFDIPLIPIETPHKENEDEVYQTTQEIKTVDPITGKTSKAVVDIKQTRKKDIKGKPFLDTELKVQQDSVKRDANVTEKKKVTNIKTEPFLITIWNDIKWWILSLLIICILGVIILKKFFPTLLKTYLRL
jgi:hypothetical protein